MMNRKYDENRKMVRDFFIPIEFRNDREFVMRSVLNSSRTFEWASDELKSDRKLIMETLVKQSAFAELDLISESLKKDKEFISKMFEMNEYLEDGASEYKIKYIMENVALKKDPSKSKKVFDRKIMLEKFKKKEIEFGELPEQFKKDDDFCLIAIQRSLNVLWEIGPQLSKEMMMKAVREASFLAFFHASEQLKKDKLFVGRLIKLDPHVLLFADKKVRRDRNIISEAAKLDVETLNYATLDLLKDLEFVKKVKASGGKKNSRDHKQVILTALSYSSGVGSLIPAALRKDAEFMLQAMINGGSDVFKHLADSLKNDKEYVLKAIKAMESSSGLDELLPESLLSDKDIAIALIENYSYNFDRFSSRTDIPFTRDLILKVMKENASAYNNLSIEFRKDKEITLEAIRGGLAYLIGHVSEELRKDKEFNLECIKENATVLKFCHNDLRFDNDFNKKAVRVNGHALAFVLERTRELEIEAVKQNGFFLPSSENIDELLKIRMEHEYPDVK